jgi:predicted kinase
MEKILFICRGLPGSGKSTFAKTLVGEKDYCHKEADMFFVDQDGNYNFRPAKLKDAHKWCREEVEFLLRLEHSPVAVSNTFTQEWEMEPYFELAKTYGYKVFSIVVENRHGGVNVHNAPEEKIEEMKNRSQIKLK